MLLYLTGAKNLRIEEMCTAIYRNDSSARAFIDNIDYAVENVSLRVTKVGAYMNRLDSAIDATDIQRENLIEAISTLKDTDVAKESSCYSNICQDITLHQKGIVWQKLLK